MKKFKNKKVIVCILLAIMLIGNINQTFAFEIGAKQLISQGECERLLTYKGVPIKTSFIVYEENGIYYPAYCLDVKLPGAEQGPYQVNGGGKIQDINVWKAIINGYPYKSLAELGAANEQEAFTATKQAVYTMLYNRDISEYGPMDSDAGRRTYQIYSNIVNAARSSTENIENYLQMNIKRVTEEWKVDNLNPKCISQTYEVESNILIGKYDIFVKGLVPNGTIVVDKENNIRNNFKIGEQFKVLIPIENLTQSESFTIEAIANLETKPVVYGSTTIPGTQDYALAGYMYEEIKNYFTEDYFKNITKIVVVKKEYGTENRLEGVKFNLLDSNKNIVHENLVTNENGEIMLENMIPGIYYLKEIETLENYNLYTDLIEINLDLNEEFKITVNNTTREVTEINKEFELVEVLPTYTETVYNVNTEKTLIEDHVNVENTIIEEHVEKKVNNQKIIKKLPVTGY